MSYILDALKRSDQQRQRGATPTLQMAQLTVAEPGRPLLVYYGLLAATLIVAGIVIGWWHPWQSSSGTEPVITETPIPISQQAAPATESTPIEQSAAVADAMMQASPTQANPPAQLERRPVKPPEQASVAQEQGAIPFNELPPEIRQQIPEMAVQLHAYSSVPGERLVSINFIRLREGESLMAGLRLEQITPDGMIFGYKGYRFSRGIR